MADSPTHDPSLLDALESLVPQAFDGELWRVTWAAHDPLIGGTGGGRWHPPNRFEVLYTSLSEDGALAEVYYHLSRQPVFSSSHVMINKLALRCDRVLIFPDVAALAPLGVSAEDFHKGAYTRTQEIGAAARFLDLQGLIVPSARWDGSNLVLFPELLEDIACLRLLEQRDINWPAWRERSRSS